jgi:outer membrane protein OmpA-like peptidoglycan-associated protein
MIHEPNVDRKPADIDRRPRSPLRITDRSSAPEPSRANALRQRAGNRGVQQLVSKPAEPGRSSGAALAARSLPIQTKLTMSEPGDAHEREADRVADAVMRMPANAEADKSTAASNGSPVKVQRICADCDEEQKRTAIPQLQGKEQTANAPLKTPVAANIQNLRGGGSALPAATRAFFEPRFGADFSNVRVHTGTRAEDAATSISARAFTLGHDIAFAKGQYSPESGEGRRLLAHELTHVMQQNRSLALRRSSASGGLMSDVIQRAGDPTKIPPGLRCPTDLTPGKPAGIDLRFTIGGSAITPAHTAQLTAFRGTWLAAGGTDNIIAHGYASTVGEQGANWTLSCDRAEAVRAELIRLGIPAVRVNVLAHGESTDFGAGLAPNQHAVVSTRAGVLPLPLTSGVLTPADNFAGRSTTRFGVGETINLSFLSLPPRPAADFGGLDWVVASGGGTITAPVSPHDGTATYTAPATAGAVTLELRVAAGATAGRVVSVHALTIVVPNGVRIAAIPGTAPNFGGFGAPLIPAGTWGAGFQGNVFVDPRDVSFRGIVFGEGTVGAVVTPAGSFLSTFASAVHPINTFGPGRAGNAATGTPVSPPPDGIFSGGRGPARTVLGARICGASDFLWAIPWEFSVAGSARVAFAIANHHATSSLLCDATIEKGGAGPFKRSI